MPMSGAGARGKRHCTISSRTRTPAASSVVAGSSCVQSPEEGPDLGHDAVPGHRDAGDLLELAHDHEDRDPRHVPDEDGLGQQVGEEAQPGEPGHQAQHADDDGQRRGQDGEARRVAGGERGHDHRGHQRGRRLGTDRQLPRRAEHRVHDRGPRRSPRARRRREAGHLGIGHHLGHQVGGDADPGEDVRAEPAALVVPEPCAGPGRSATPRPISLPAPGRVTPDPSASRRHHGGRRSDAAPISR